MNWNWHDVWSDDWLDDHYKNSRKQHKLYLPNKKEQNVKLQVGDRVRLRHGKNTLIVEDVYSTNRASARYEHSNQIITRRIDDFVITEHNVTEQGYGKMKGKLFQTTDGRFGIGLAINSAGKYVLEMKGSGDLEAFDKSAIEVVMPFTFSVKFSTGSTEYQYLGKEGSVAVGDLLLAFDSGHKNGGISIAQVTGVNTKSEKATKHFAGVKVVTMPLEAE
jgi:hypothetical protein